ncbi:type 2 DNA topoisomerase 6 subunit B-like isoform X2 [Tasmannia lanceolata]|uniref:type 2 DNA topoisomerase 6 subunit B-like isoform X2 n=1 Tax=Tasmannia lanceolata TaxID=3420 RepID=UPI004063B386
MEISSARKLCQNLIAFSIQRCRISENLCRLSVVLQSFPDLDPAVVRVAISDTGAGSSLAEFQDMGYAGNHVSAENWGNCDKEIYRYSLNLKETIATTRLTRLPATAKKGGNFSGTEVSFSTNGSIEEFVAWITGFCRKILILKIPNVAVELIVEHMNSPSSRYEYFLQANEGVLLPSSVSYVERLTSGVEEYILKHRNALDREFQTCFSSRKHLKVGSGVTCTAESIRNTEQVMEAVIVIVEVPESSDCSCLRACSTTTEVLYFQDFSPSSSIPLSSLNALTSIDWQSYGLTLRDNHVDLDGNAVLKWENLPPFTHMDIVLHSYHKKAMIPQTQQRTQVDRNLVKKAVKLAIDDLKTKYMGTFLSPHALKIRSYAPDLSRTIAGLILSSNDSVFRGECASLLRLDPLDIGEEGKVESSIREKIIGVIEMNDRRPKRGRDHAPCLFEDDGIHDEDYRDENDDYEEGEEGVSVLDL